MKFGIVYLGACALVLTAAAPALAQQAGNVGVIASSSGLGMHLKAGDRFAVRPEFSFATSSIESSDTLALNAKTESTSTTLGVSAPVYLQRDGQFRTYLSPRFAWMRSKSTVGTTEDPARSQYALSGSFGADYRVGDRFMVFGELGVGYTWSSIEATTLSATATLKNHTTATRSVVGVGIFF